MTYVIGKSGNPLMPTDRGGRVRILLKTGMAEIVSMKPFTIRLLYDTPEVVQPLHGGADPGRTNIGEAVLTENGEVVYAAHLETQNKSVPKRMQKRAACRQASRRGERKRKQRRARKNGTVTTPTARERVLPKCEEPIINKWIKNSEARFANRKREPGWLTPTANHLFRRPYTW